VSAPAEGMGGSLAEEIEALDEALPTRRRLPVVQTVTPASGRVRPRTLSMRRQSKRELERLRLLYPESDAAQYERPATRGDCEGEQGPCPWVSCKWNLYLDVNPHNGNIKLNFPDREVWELPETCALHVADRGGITLEQVGTLVNLTRERIRQLEDQSIAHIKSSPDAWALADLVADEPLVPLSLGPALHLRVRLVAVESQAAASRAASTKGGRW